MKELTHIETNKEISPFDLFRLGILLYRVDIFSTKVEHNATWDVKLIIRLPNAFKYIIHHTVGLN